MPLTERPIIVARWIAQNMVPVHGEYELLFGSSSADKDLKKVHYRF